eukprot:TRINITY_DN17911_c0_g1_i1.p1 TRINITY_DN17911_c0_g1~~TRINITY_DN17911_c0_g1_i1.p1  ORF type:complete len:927 (+),score=171.06 TRINITY_DN17911_c0_g1_i1:33-2783(+)
MASGSRHEKRRCANPKCDLTCHEDVAIGGGFCCKRCHWHYELDIRGAAHVGKGYEEHGNRCLRRWAPSGARAASPVPPKEPLQLPKEVANLPVRDGASAPAATSAETSRRDLNDRFRPAGSGSGAVSSSHASASSGARRSAASPWARPKVEVPPPPELRADAKPRAEQRRRSPLQLRSPERRRRSRSRERRHSHSRSHSHKRRRRDRDVESRRTTPKEERSPRRSSPGERSSAPTVKSRRSSPSPRSSRRSAAKEERSPSRSPGQAPKGKGKGTARTEAMSPQLEELKAGMRIQVHIPPEDGDERGHTYDGRIGTVIEKSHSRGRIFWFVRLEYKPEVDRCQVKMSFLRGDLRTAKDMLLDPAFGKFKNYIGAGDTFTESGDGESITTDSAKSVATGSGGSGLVERVQASARSNATIDEEDIVAPSTRRTAAEARPHGAGGPAAEALRSASRGPPRHRSAAHSRSRAGALAVADASVSASNAAVAEDEEEAPSARDVASRSAEVSADADSGSAAEALRPAGAGTRADAAATASSATTAELEEEATSARDAVGRSAEASADADGGSAAEASRPASRADPCSPAAAQSRTREGVGTRDDASEPASDAEAPPLREAASAAAEASADFDGGPATEVLGPASHASPQRGAAEQSGSSADASADVPPLSVRDAGSPGAEAGADADGSSCAKSAASSRATPTPMVQPAVAESWLQPFEHIDDNLGADARASQLVRRGKGVGNASSRITPRALPSAGSTTVSVATTPAVPSERSPVDTIAGPLVPEPLDGRILVEGDYVQLSRTRETGWVCGAGTDGYSIRLESEFEHNEIHGVAPDCLLFLMTAEKWQAEANADADSKLFLDQIPAGIPSPKAESAPEESERGDAMTPATPIGGENDGRVKRRRLSRKQATPSWLTSPKEETS